MTHDFISTLIEFRKENCKSKAFLVNEQTLQLSNSILTDNIDDNTHKNLHKWGEWFLINMAIDYADVNVFKNNPGISRHNEIFRSKHDDELIKIMNGNVNDLLNHIRTEHE